MQNLKFDLIAHAEKKRFKVCEEIRPQRINHYIS